MLCTYSLLLHKAYVPMYIGTSAQRPARASGGWRARRGKKKLGRNQYIDWKSTLVAKTASIMASAAEFGGIIKAVEDSVDEIEIESGPIRSTDDPDS